MPAVDTDEPKRAGAVAAVAFCPRNVIEQRKQSGIHGNQGSSNSAPPAVQGVFASERAL